MGFGLDHKLLVYDLRVLESDMPTYRTLSSIMGVAIWAEHMLIPVFENLILVMNDFDYCQKDFAPYE